MERVSRLEPHRAVVLEQGKRVATFTFQQSRWHLQPGEFFCRFTLEPEVAKANYEEVVRLLYGTALPRLREEGALLLRTGVTENDPLAKVLRSLGFRTYRHVFTPVLEVQTYDLGQLEPFERETRELGFDITTLAELGLSDAVVMKFRALHDEVYSEGSGAVPATPHLWSLDEWHADVLGTDFLPDACFIAVRDGEFAAFANLYPADLMPENRGTELDTATFGTSQAYRHVHTPVTLALWAHLARYAQNNGYRTIRAEIDSDYPWILEICAHFPMTLGEDYISLVRALNWTVLPDA